MDRPTVHLIGPGPHSETTRAWEPDAYSAKTRRLGSMLTSRGYRVILYGGVRNESEVSEFVPLVSFEERERWFPGFTPHLETFTNWDSNLEPWRVFNQRAANEIRKRAQKGDILGMSMGGAHHPIAEAVADLELYAVETGIGYSGIWAPYRVFESRSWEHYIQGRDHDDLRQFDVVIPNSYEPDEFPPGSGDGGFHLFASRFIHKKGISIAALATEKLGVPLVVIGSGMMERKGSTYRGLDVEVTGEHIDHRGSVSPAERARLMGAATALWAPTLYCEPFGGVVVEAMLTGTPAITSDFGAFTEHVSHGFNGFRCRTLQQFVDAGRAVSSLNRAAIRENALSRWSTDVAAAMYDAYFQQLTTLAGKGWYTLREEEDGDVVGPVGVDVQPAGEDPGRDVDGRRRTPAELPVRHTEKVGRNGKRSARTLRVGVPAAEDADGRAVLPRLRAVGD